MSVSLPLTIVIFTQMSALAVLKLLTIFVNTSESGGVWLVQNFTTVALAAHDAPVTGEGFAAEDAPAAGLAAVLAPVLAPGLAAELHAPTTNIATTARIHRDRPKDRLIAPPSSLFRSASGARSQRLTARKLAGAASKESRRRSLRHGSKDRSAHLQSSSGRRGAEPPGSRTPERETQSDRCPLL